MFLIRLITDRYGVRGITEEIIGYATTEELAKKFCKEETPNLKYNKNMGNKYYNYQRIDNVYEEETNPKKANDLFKRRVK